MEIAGKRTDKDWKVLGGKLENGAALWQTAFDDFFMARLNTRYLGPIKLLQKHGVNQGEGFSIVSIQCALIEFLQTVRDGENFKFRKRDNSAAKESNKWEYGIGQSRKIFTTFLKQQQPFCSSVGAKYAASFYSDVRCSLLHEARTTGNWRITARADRTETIKEEDGTIWLQRDLFQKDLETYIWNYKVELLGNDKLKEAFKRKFDALSKSS